MKPVLVIGAAASPVESSPWMTGMRPRSWAKLVDAFLGTPHEVLLHRIKDGEVIHYDMAVFPRRGDALDHFDKASVVIADHLYYDSPEPSSGHFFNRKNNQIVAVAEKAGVPLFLFGDYPMRSRKPDEMGLGWRLYLPRVRSNPLVGWEHVGPLPPPEEIDRSSRPMYSKNAPKVYEEKLKGTKLDIHVVFGEGAGNRVQELAGQGRTVLWMKRPLKEALRSAYSTVEGGPQRLDGVFARKRGELGRVSPMTPFTLLHRMGDVIRGLSPTEMDDIGHLFRLLLDFEYPEETLEMSLDDYRRRLFSSGVGTLAGREGWFRSYQEATSDLWAKYLLTGQIDYNPTASPLDGGPWLPDELRARSDYLERLHHYFPIWLKRAKGEVYAISEA